MRLCLAKVSPAPPPRLSYIWSITGIESGQVVMVLNPARAEPRAEASALGQEKNATSPQSKESLLPASSQKSRYHDVREDANRILTGVGDISQIPIGMSGL